MGVISLTYSMETDRLAGIKANSVHVDANFSTLLNATNNKLEKDGSIVPTADLPMGNHKLTGVATPTLSGDAATKGYVDSNACMLAGAQTITGNKSFSGSVSFSNTISGSINGNAATVTNGVYTTGNQTINGTKTFGASPIVPTPSASDNSTKVATTAWIRAHMSPNTSSVTTINAAGGSASGTYTITGNGGWLVSFGVNGSGSIYVNGVEVATGNWRHNDWSGNTNCQIIVKNGDVVSWNYSGTSPEIKFMPFA